MQLGHATKFPIRISKIREIESEAFLLNKLEEQLNSMDLHITNNPMIILRENQIIPSTSHKYLRVICQKKHCSAKLIYQFDLQKNAYILTIWNNEHTHEIYVISDFIGKRIKQLTGVYSGKNNAYQLDGLYQDETMKQKYIKYGKCLYINIIQIKQNSVAYFTGFNSMMDVVIFAISIFEICSQEKFNSLISDFVQKNPKCPQTVISMNETIVQICRKHFNSVCFYCFDDLLPVNMKLREGILRLLNETQTENQWELQHRKVLLFVRNTLPPMELKRIYDNYKKLAIFNLPLTFVNLGVHINLRQLLNQHGNQYAYRYKIQLEQSKQKNVYHKGRSKHKRKIPSSAKFQGQSLKLQHSEKGPSIENKQIFVKLVPKLIQTSLPNMQTIHILSELKQIQKSQIKNQGKAASRFNSINYQIYQKYSPHIISYLLQQRNRASYCDLMPIGKLRFIVKHMNEKDEYLSKEENIIQNNEIENQKNSQGIIEQKKQPQLINQKPQKFMKWVCTCNLMKKTGLPCCHIMKILALNNKQQQLTDYIDSIWNLEKFEELNHKKSERLQKK